MLEIVNATLEIRNSNNEVVSRIDGDTGAAMFGKGAHLFNADGSLDLANESIIWDLINGLLVRGKIESNEKGNRVVIDPVSRSIIMLDASDNKLSEYTFDSEEGNRGARLSLKGVAYGNETSTTLWNGWISTESKTDDSQTIINPVGITIADKTHSFIRNDMVALAASEIILENIPDNPQRLGLKRMYHDKNGFLKITLD